MHDPFNTKKYHDETGMVDHIIANTPLMAWQKIENNVNVPDLYYSGLTDDRKSNGWIEAKYSHGYNKDGSVTIHRFTRGQRNWLLDMADAGTDTWIMLGVNCDIFLMSPNRFRGYGKNHRLNITPNKYDIKITSPACIYDAICLIDY